MSCAGPLSLTQAWQALGWAGALIALALLLIAVAFGCALGTAGGRPGHRPMATRRIAREAREDNRPTTPSFED